MRPTISDIIRIVSTVSGIPEDTIAGKCRKREHIIPRFAVCRIAHEQGYSSKRIAMRLGGRDHTSVLHALDKCERLRISNSDEAARYRKILDDVAAWLAMTEPERARIAEQARAKAKLEAAVRAEVEEQERCMTRSMKWKRTYFRSAYKPLSRNGYLMPDGAIICIL